MTARVNKAKLFASLTAPWPEDLLPRIREAVAKGRRKLVVLDDDPTGTQTVHDVPVLTSWDMEALRAELADDAPCFYLLTNTRAVPAAEAIQINREIGRNLTIAAGQHPGRQDIVVVSRSDSTLRGHFPAEVDALGLALTPSLESSGPTRRPRLPPVLLVPYFEAGGRYTVNDVHYVAEGDELVPAAETPFARDAAFGYRHSNLRAGSRRRPAAPCQRQRWSAFPARICAAEVPRSCGENWRRCVTATCASRTRRRRAIWRCWPGRRCRRRTRAAGCCIARRQVSSRPGWGLHHGRRGGRLR